MVGLDAELRVSTRSHTAPPLKRGLAVALTVAVLMLLLVSSFSPIAGAASGNSSAASNGHRDTTPASASPANSHSKRESWDWPKLADKTGYVNVIVSWSSNQDPNSSAGSHDGKFRGLMAELRSGMKERYTKALTGFAAHISLGAVDEYLQSDDESFQVYPDYTVNATASGDMTSIGADQVWATQDPTGAAVTGKGIVVAVIDTGIDYMHPDLGGGFGPGYKVIGGYDFYNNDPDPMDDNGHGTHVAGVIAASGGMTGVAPGASLLAYKVLGPDGSGSVSNVIEAIDRSMDPNQDGDTSDHANIISMSLGGPGQSGDPVCTAVENAVNAGIVVVVAAGNDGPAMGTVASPGLAPDAITVGAVDNSGVLASFSSRGTSPNLSIKPEICAPGVNINSTVPFSGAARSSPTGYAIMSGTSMATPHVSGAAALLLQEHPGWTPMQVKSALVSGANRVNESVWAAGSGDLWIPAAINSSLFFYPSIVSYGLAGSASSTVNISNSGSGVTLTLTSSDFFELDADGTMLPTVWTNISSANPASVWAGSASSTTSAITVPMPTAQIPEGYYDGQVTVSGGSCSVRLPFGFAVLSRLNVHVLDANGTEVYDPYGGVWVFNDPNGSVALGIRGSVDEPAPPASFLLPSGNYSVHSFGHQLLYQFSDPFVLGANISLASLETRDVYLTMSSARIFTLDLQTDAGLPIYVKDYRVYGRYVGDHNISFQLVGSDYSVTGSEVFSLPMSKNIYVSDTDIAIGISISGFAYSPAMWDFMSRNWQHWYEYTGSDSTTFYPEASADLQYLLAWEFNGISSATPTMLSLVPGEYSVYDTKYDIPGMLSDVWCDWGTLRPIGGDSAFYIRRDTDTSLNPFYSGMTRRTIVQGVFSEVYFPADLFEGFFEREFYTPNYTSLVRANTAAEVYMPDRNFLTPIDDVASVERVGAGPFYPAVRTANTADSFVLYQPLLRDQSGAKVGGMSLPQMYLYLNGQLYGAYQIAEHLARPDAMRITSLSSPGKYTADIDYSPVPQICGNVNIELGFTIPGTDMDPPQITGLNMSQRFVPGDIVPITVNAIDLGSSPTVSISWRAGAASPWVSIPVTALGGSSFGAAIQTSSSTTSIDLMITATDAAGNYLKYTASDAAEAQVPVVFDLSASSSDVSYRNGDASVVLTGTLTDALGNPLSPIAGVPIELSAGGRKVAMILDEYVADGTHSHNGTIRFEWHFNPTYIFTGPNETVDIDASFDLGIYQPVHCTITLHSIYFYDPPPVITLVSPVNGSLIPAGQTIDLQITDNGPFQVQMSLDGGAQSALLSPYDISTSSWTSGSHVLRITATDDQFVSTTCTFNFVVDTTFPVIRIIDPLPGSSVPVVWTLVANVTDDHLGQVTYALDGGSPQALQSPYTINMTGWAIGSHTVVIYAVDLAGHHSSNSTTFQIVSSTLVLTLVSPQSGDVVHSGVPISFTVLSLGACTNSWQESGTWHSLGNQTSISTVGWPEGPHTVTINSTDAYGGWGEISVSFTIDDTPPTIVLVSPANQSFVSSTDKLSVAVSDANFKSVSWTLWGATRTSSSASLSISLTPNPGDGMFYVDVKALDKAGNQARDLFVFALDSSPPALSVSGFVSGQAVRPDQVIAVNASDAFLSSVSFVVDSGPLVVLQAPYTLNCSSLALGWHMIQLRADDYSGKSTMLNVSLYVDGVAPTVVTEFPSVAEANTSLVLEANITDDFAVSKAMLYYELRDGAFVSVLLHGSGSIYSATVPGSSLWDGMVAYVVAYDFVGHSTQSPEVALHISSAATAPETPVNHQGLPSYLNLGLVSTLSLAVICGSVALFFALGRRRHDEPRKTISSKFGRGSSGPSPLNADKTTLAVHDSAVVAWQAPGRQIDAPMPKTRAADIVVPPAPSVAVPQPEQVGQPELIDAIPTVKLKSPEPEAVDAADGTDYGDLIMKELVFPSLLNSVYEKEQDHLFEEVDRKLDELEQILAKDSKKTLEK